MTIHAAVKEGNIKEVRNILNQGTYVDLENLSHDTPLHYASLYGRPEIVSFLIA